MNITTEELTSVLKIVANIATNSSVWMELFPDKSGKICALDDRGGDKTLFSFGVDFLGFYKNLGDFLSK